MDLKGWFDKTFSSKKNDWTIKTVTETPIEVVDENRNKDLIEELHLIKVDEDTLMFSKIDSESETIKSYLSMLIKDIAKYNDFKYDKEKKEETIKGICSKIKQITAHGMELRNLLSSLEDHYFNPLIDVLKKVNERLAKSDVESMIESLEKDLAIVRGLEDNIGKLISYDMLFNSEKNKKYNEAIETELDKKVINSDINELTKSILNTIIDKTLSVKSRIEHGGIIDKVKFML